MQYECMKEQRINEQMWENKNQCSKLLDYLYNSQNLGKCSKLLDYLYNSQNLGKLSIVEAL